MVVSSNALRPTPDNDQGNNQDQQDGNHTKLLHSMKPPVIYRHHSTNRTGCQVHTLSHTR